MTRKHRNPILYLLQTALALTLASGCATASKEPATSPGRRLTAPIRKTPDSTSRQTNTTQTPSTNTGTKTQTAAQHEPWLSTEDVKRACENSRPRACFFLAVGITLKSGVVLPRLKSNEARPLLHKECDLSIDGVGCHLAAVQFYLNDDLETLSDDSASARRELAFLAKRGCSLASEENRQLFCSLAQQVEKLALPGDITARFPQTVAGFRFGCTPGEALNLCETSLNLTPTTHACVPAPIDPFQAESTVVLRFCEDRLCEIGVVFEQHDNQVVERVMAMLSHRYGTAASTAVVRKCQAPNSKPFRRSWFSRPYDKQEAGMLAAIYECNGKTSSPQLSLWYRNEAGMRMRGEERRKLDANY